MQRMYRYVDRTFNIIRDLRINVESDNIDLFVKLLFSFFVALPKVSQNRLLTINLLETIILLFTSCRFSVPK